MVLVLRELRSQENDFRHTTTPKGLTSLEGTIICNYYSSFFNDRFLDFLQIFMPGVFLTLTLYMAAAQTFFAMFCLVNDLSFDVVWCIYVCRGEPCRRRAGTFGASYVMWDTLDAVFKRFYFCS